MNETSLNREGYPDTRSDPMGTGILYERPCVAAYHSTTINSLSGNQNLTPGAV